MASYALIRCHTPLEPSYVEPPILRALQPPKGLDICWDCFVDNIIYLNLQLKIINRSLTSYTVGALRCRHTSRTALAELEGSSCGGGPNIWTQLWKHCWEIMLIILPVQLNPSPSYPCLQEQMCDPAVFVQSAFSWHLLAFVAHSLIS